MRTRLRILAACIALLFIAAAHAAPWVAEGHYPTKAMQGEYSDPKNTRYDRENNVLYLDDQFRAQFKVEFKLDSDGKQRAYYPNGSRVDTRVRNKGTGDVSLEQAIFVMDADGGLFVIMDGLIPWPADMPKEKIPRLHHSTIPAGQPVAAAGHIMVEDGILRRIDNNSGHYKPENHMLVEAIKALQEVHHIDKGTYDVAYEWHDPVPEAYLILDEFGKAKRDKGDILRDTRAEAPPDQPKAPDAPRPPADETALLTPDEPTPIPQLDVDRRAAEQAVVPAPVEAAHPVDPPDPSVVERIRDKIAKTPADQMDIEFMKELYQIDPKAAKVAGQVLADPSLFAQNEKMGQLRKQMDLLVWKKILAPRGIQVEITNQGKSNGARSDLDYTLYYLAEEAGISIADLIGEHAKTWKSLHQLAPEQLEIKVMNGDEFYPDWRSEALTESEHQLAVKKLLGQLRLDPEKYSVPGANKQQVHNRALRDGWTEVLRYDPLLDKPGTSIEAQLVRAQGPTRSMSLRYRGVHPQYNHMNALGNLIQNKGEFFHHSGDAAQDSIRRAKYFNRIINEGLGNLRFFANDYKQLYDSDLPDRNARTLAYLEKTLGLLKDDNGKPLLDGAELRKFRDVIDVSMRVELDKTGDRSGKKADFSARRAEYFKDYKSKAEGRVPMTLDPEERAKAVLDEQQRLFEIDQKRVMAESVLAGLRHSVARDLTPEGALRNRVRFDPATEKFVIDDPEGAKKVAFERATEVALFYELVNSLPDSDPDAKFMKIDMKKRALATAPTIELAEFYGALDEVGKAEIDRFTAGDPDGVVGRKIDDLLRKQQAQALEELIERKKRAVERAQAKGILIDMGRVPPDEVARHIVDARVDTLTPGRRALFRAAFAELGSQLHGDFKEAFYQNASGLMMGSSAVNLIRAWQTGDPRALQYAAFTEAINYMPDYIQTPFTVIDLLAKVHRGEYIGATYQASLFFAMAKWPGLGHAMLGYNVATGTLDIVHTHFVNKIDVDLTEQALRSRPRDEDGMPLRDGVRARPNRYPDARESVYNGSGPGFPLFFGRYRNEHALDPILVDGQPYSDGRVPEDDWSDEKLAAAATYEFASQIDQDLTAAGLVPGSDAWSRRAWELKLKYGFDIPFYRRMAKVYESKYKYITYYEYINACRLDVYDWYADQPPGYKLELQGEAKFWFSDQTDKMQEKIAQECAVTLRSMYEVAERAKDTDRANLASFNAAMTRGFDAEHALLAAKKGLHERIEADERKAASEIERKALTLADKHTTRFTMSYPFTFATEEAEAVLEFDTRTLQGIADKSLNVELDQTITGMKEGAPAAWKPGKAYADKFKPDASGWVAFRPVTVALKITGALVDADGKTVATSALDLPVVLYEPSFSGIVTVRVLGADESGTSASYEGATVTLGGKTAVADSTGTVVFEHLKPGPQAASVAPRKDDKRHQPASGTAALTDPLTARDLRGDRSATIEVVLPYVPEPVAGGGATGKPGAGDLPVAGGGAKTGGAGSGTKKKDDGGGTPVDPNDPKVPAVDPALAQQGVAAIDAAMQRCEFESALALYEGLDQRLDTSPVVAGWKAEKLAALTKSAQAQAKARAALATGQAQIAAGQMDAALASLAEARALAPECMRPPIDSLIADLTERKAGGLIHQAEQAELACDYKSAKALADAIANLQPQTAVLAKWLVANQGRIAGLAGNQREARTLIASASESIAAQDWPGALALLRRARAVPAPDCDGGAIDGLIGKIPEDGGEDAGEGSGEGGAVAENTPGDEVPEGLLGTERTPDAPRTRTPPSTPGTGTASGGGTGTSVAGLPPIEGGGRGGTGGGTGGGSGDGGSSGGAGTGGPGGGGPGGGPGGGTPEYSACSDCFRDRCASVCAGAPTLLCVVSSASYECLSCAAACDGLPPPPRPAGGTQGAPSPTAPSIADYSGTWELAYSGTPDAVMTLRTVDLERYQASPVHALISTSSCWKSAKAFYVGEISFPPTSRYRQREGMYDVVDVKPGPIVGCLMDLNDGLSLYYYFAYTQVERNDFQGGALQDRPDTSSLRFRPVSPSELSDAYRSSARRR